MNTEDDTLKISTERVHHMIHENLGMRKFCAKWVPCELIFDQKQRRVDDSEQCLKMIKRNKPEFLRPYVTMDETWLHYFTPSTVGWQGYGISILGYAWKRKDRFKNP
ncbi:hypothetical protein GWI33_016765 [Rhynchophorus ferrugineus]|uniref:Transposase n=1 Tax=Rhynchophorus ferrugineus TaxID=354439 RepID=A0A834HWS2_RHYFE|nr:hypothetical protein GWI33_016765 [Rhynchophorus ferrugineus]